MVNTYDAIHIEGDATRLKVYGLTIDGDSSQTRHGIHRDSSNGTLTDCSFWDIDAFDLAGSVFSNIIGSANGTRTIVNGHAWNDGNPSTTGDWNGNAEQAIERGVHTVWDDSGSDPPTAYTPYQTASGSGWRAKGYSSP